MRISQVMKVEHSTKVQKWLNSKENPNQIGNESKKSTKNHAQPGHTEVITCKKLEQLA
jgi:hypothetical protein